MARRPSTDQRTDAELVLAADAGDRAAFGELYRRHSLATRLAISDRVQDRDRQTDLVQEVFARALAKLGTLRDPDRFRPWVLQIARNVGTDDLREQRRHHHAALDGVDVADQDAARPEHVTELRLLVTAMESGLVALNGRDAAAVSLSLHHGAGPNEIAAELGISRANAKVVLHRARRRLRTALTERDLLAS